VHGWWLSALQAACARSGAAVDPIANATAPANVKATAFGHPDAVPPLTTPTPNPSPQGGGEEFAALL